MPRLPIIFTAINGTNVAMNPTIPAKLLKIRREFTFSFFNFSFEQLPLQNGRPLERHRRSGSTPDMVASTPIRQAVNKPKSSATSRSVLACAGVVYHGVFPTASTVDVDRLFPFYCTTDTRSPVCGSVRAPGILSRPLSGLPSRAAIAAIGGHRLLDFAWRASEVIRESAKWIRIKIDQHIRHFAWSNRLADLLTKNNNANVRHGIVTNNNETWRNDIKLPRKMAINIPSVLVIRVRAVNEPRIDGSLKIEIVSFFIAFD